ncbi:MAG: O-antigen ligase family protein [Candidatus Methylomirabilales bacterium]
MGSDAGDRLARPLLFSVAGLLIILPLFDGGRSFEARTVFVAFIGILFLLALSLGGRDLPVSGFFLLTLFLLAASLRSAYADLSLQASLLLLAYFLAFALTSAFCSERSRLFFVYSLVFSGLLAATVAIAMSLLARPGSLEALALRGTFHYPNGLAGFLLLTLYPSFALLLHAEGKRAWVLGLSASIMLLALLLTRSRGGWLVFLLTFLFLAFHERRLFVRRRLRLASVGLLFLALAWASAPDAGPFTYPSHVARLASGMTSSTPDPSFDYRRHIYAWALQIFLDHPFLGTGPGTFPLMLGRYQKIPYLSGLYVHNHYLQTAAEMGLVGLFLLLALLACLFWRGAKAVRRLPPSSLERSIALSLLTALLASVLHAGIDFAWSYPAIALGVVLEAALLMSYSRPPISDPSAQTPYLRPRRALATVLLLGMLLLVFARFYTEVSLRWGKWALRDGLVNEAEGAFQRASRLYPFSYAAHYWLSVIFAKQGKQEEAVREAEAALRLNPEDGDAYHHLGKTYWRVGRLEEAEQALARAIQFEPASKLRFYVDLGALLLARGRPEEARRIHQRAVEVFTPELVLSRNARCLVPGDRYLLATIVERLRQVPDSQEGRLAERLRKPDLRGICRGGLEAGFTSPEATILTHWKAVREGRSGLLVATFTRELRQRLNAKTYAVLPAWPRDARVLRIVELQAGETEAWVIYELAVGERRLRLRDRLRLEGDGWRLAQLRQ